MHLRDMARFDYLQDKNGKLYLIDANSLPAFSNNYLYEYISTGRLRLEPVSYTHLDVYKRQVFHSPFPAN